MMRLLIAVGLCVSLIAGVRASTVGAVALQNPGLVALTPAEFTVTVTDLRAGYYAAIELTCDVHALVKGGTYPYVQVSEPITADGTSTVFFSTEWPDAAAWQWDTPCTAVLFTQRAGRSGVNSGNTLASQSFVVTGNPIYTGN